MSVAPSARWSAYALGAVLTLAAAVWVSDADDSASVVQPATRAAPAPSAAVAQAGNAAQNNRSSGLALPLPRQPQEPTADPFAVLDAEPGIVAAGAAARAAPTVQARPSAPDMPFIYLGSWKEHGKTSVFVQREDRSYKVAGPGPLDAEYAVQSVDENSITFNYLPLGIVQELRLDAPPPAPSAATAAAAPATSTPEPDQGN